MKSFSQNFQRQLSFILILLIGLSYLAFLYIFSQKVYSGFLMQFIFLFNSLVINSQSIVSLVSGFFWLYCLFLLLRTIVRLSIQISGTSRFVKSLRISQSKPDYSIFVSTKPLAFTAGYFRPRIFLSSRLLSISSPSELSSILAHEKSHQLNYDPLKSLFVGFVSSIVPYFPGKPWLFGQYQTLVEISCDRFSQSLSSHPSTLVSALLKMQTSANYSFISNFSAQSERIKILVGHKTQPIQSVFTANLVMIAFLIVSTSYLNHSDLFYQCQHLIKCFENMFIADHLLPESSSVNHQCNLP